MTVNVYEYARDLNDASYNAIQVTGEATVTQELDSTGAGAVSAQFASTTNLVEVQAPIDKDVYLWFGSNTNLITATSRIRLYRGQSRFYIPKNEGGTQRLVVKDV